MGKKRCRCGCGGQVPADSDFQKKCFLRLVAEGITEVTFDGATVTVKYARSKEQQTYRAEHKDEAAASRAEHKDEAAAYRAEHKDEYAAYQQAYRGEHKDESKAHKAVHTQRNAILRQIISDERTLAFCTHESLTPYEETQSTLTGLLAIFKEAVANMPDKHGMIVQCFFASEASYQSKAKPEALRAYCWDKRPTLVPAARRGVFGRDEMIERGYEWKRSSLPVSQAPIARHVENEFHNYLFLHHKSLAYKLKGPMPRVVFTHRACGAGSYYEGTGASRVGLCFNYKDVHYDPSTGVSTLHPDIELWYDDKPQPRPIWRDGARGEPDGAMLRKALAMVEQSGATLAAAASASAAAGSSSSTAAPMAMPVVVGSLLAMVLISEHKPTNRDAFWTVLVDAADADGYVNISVANGSNLSLKAPFPQPFSVQPDLLLERAMDFVAKEEYAKVIARGSVRALPRESNERTHLARSTPLPAHIGFRARLLYDSTDQ